MGLVPTWGGAGEGAGHLLRVGGGRGTALQPGAAEWGWGAQPEP